MFDTYYVIRKSRFGERPIPMSLRLIIPVSYIIIPILMLIFIYLDYRNGDIEDFFVMVAFIFMFIVYGFVLLSEGIKLKKVKEFKHNGGGIVKKAKVKDIKKIKANKGRGHKVDVYYFEAEEGGMVYYSNGYTKGALLGTSIDELILLYGKYGFTYDEKQSQKEDLLRKLDELIAEKEYEIENSGFISKIAKSKKLAQLTADKTTASLGYIPAYWQIEDKKVTVGDTVDVYVDPDKLERYWVDTDFLFGN